MSWERIRDELQAELGEPISIDALTGAWKIAQRVAGHRHSADDVLTAYTAVAARPDVDRILDLGTGIGTVGLMVLSRMPRATLVCIEAQAISYRLLRANIEGNGLAARVDARHGDLRDFAMANADATRADAARAHAGDGRFPLITGSPPYFPLGTGVLPDDPQKIAARFETRGDVSDYARAAAKHLARDGAFVFCFPTPQRERALAAVEAAGLVTTRMRDVIPRATLRPLFTLFTCEWQGALVVDEPLVVRHENGSVTDEMLAVRHSFGFEQS